MSLLDKETPVKVTYVNVKSKQEETVDKGSRAERLLKISKSWKVKVVPTK